MTDAPERVWLDCEMQPWRVWTIEMNDLPEYVHGDLVCPMPMVAVLVEALKACVASLERAKTAEGVCCCGDDMDRHSDPMWCGHSPTDMGEYYAHKALEAAASALAAWEGRK
jgi:hypothetical protein